MAGIIAVTGRTYECRNELKRLGARWDPERRVWVAAKAGMSRAPLHPDRPTYERIQAAIDEGTLRGCSLEWLR